MNKILSLIYELLGLTLAGKVTDDHSQPLENFVAQFREKAEQTAAQVTAFVSEWFHKGTVLNIVASTAELVVSEEEHNEFWQEIKIRETERANPNVSIDDDIWKWFKGQKIPGFAEAFVSVIYRFLKTITHRQILDEAEKKGIKKIYTLKQARAIIKAAIFAGEVDALNKSVFAYFMIDGNTILYRLNAFRLVDGWLRVSVHEVHVSDEWDPEDGACFSN